MLELNRLSKQYGSKLALQGVSHVNGVVNPADDVMTINLELIYSDIEIVERRIDRAPSFCKAGYLRCKHQ